ncbi:MAG: Ig-like domain repeat protein [Thermoleophilia bacterium]|nr:Ig-like domain repeat protein [Thermoleophilia bacterium]
MLALVRRSVILIVVLLATLVAPGLASAASITWDGSASQDFADDANWVGGIAPGAADSAVITSAGLSPIVSTTVVLDQLRLESGADFSLAVGADLTAEAVDAAAGGPGGTVFLNGGTFTQPTSDLGDLTVVIQGGTYQPTGPTTGGTIRVITNGLTPNDGSVHGAFTGTSIVVVGSRTTTARIELGAGATIATEDASALTAPEITWTAGGLVPPADDLVLLDTVVVATSGVSLTPNSDLSLANGYLAVEHMTIPAASSVNLLGTASLQQDHAFFEPTLIEGAGLLNWTPNYASPTLVGSAFDPITYSGVSLAIHTAGVPDGDYCLQSSDGGVTTFVDSTLTIDAAVEGIALHDKVDLRDGSRLVKTGAAALFLDDLELDEGAQVASPSKVLISAGSARVVASDNVAAGVLAGGDWRVATGATLTFNQDVNTLAAYLSLGGTGAVTVASTAPLNSKLALIDSSGTLAVTGNATYVPTVDFTSGGKILIASGSAFKMHGADLTLTGTSQVVFEINTPTGASPPLLTAMYGRIDAEDGILTLDGVLTADVAGYTPNYDHYWNVVRDLDDVTLIGSFDSVTTANAAPVQFHVKDAPPVGSSIVTIAATESIAPIAPSSVTPDDVHLAASTNTSATVTWPAGSDADSGVQGYEVAFDQSSTTTLAYAGPVDTDPATSTKTSLLTEGTWYAHVATVDWEGNISATRHSPAIVIDLTAPTASFASTPPALTSGRASQFAFSSTEAGTFTCSMDGATAATCPTVFPTLADGLHTLTVRAVDVAGNTSAPIVHSWTIDSASPIVTTATVVTGSVSGAATLSFTSEAGAALTCTIDGGAEFACASPLALTGLAVGLHHVGIIARDAAGNTTMQPVLVGIPPSEAVVPPVPPVTPPAPVKAGTAKSDIIFGNALANAINALAGNDVVKGLAGNDKIAGGPGNDKLDGGAGNDVVDGGAGKDAIVGGPGLDKLVGGTGNDVIAARDGSKDTIACGAGVDKVTADKRDKVANDCEKVTRK